MEFYNDNILVAKIDENPALKKAYENSIKIRNGLQKIAEERVRNFADMVLKETDDALAAENKRFWKAAEKELMRLDALPPDFKGGEGKLHVCTKHRLISADKSLFDFTKDELVDVNSMVPQNAMIH